MGVDVGVGVSVGMEMIGVKDPLAAGSEAMGVSLDGVKVVSPAKTSSTASIVRILPAKDEKKVLTGLGFGERLSAPCAMWI